MQELPKIDAASHDIEHAGKTGDRERKPWHTPKGTIVEVAKLTKGPFGIGSDGNSCHS